ncbi:MAG: FAD-dependent oxidoreductase [Gammaproteobacteria bacterium]
MQKPVATADVLIIGGGLAGLTCAVGLLDSGLRVVVLERAAILGGRAASWNHAASGDVVSIGPHILLNQYHNMFKLLDRLGTRERIVWQSDKRFLTMVEGQRKIVIRNSCLPPPYHFVPSFMTDPQIGFRDLISNWQVVRLAFEMDEERLLSLDSINALDFLRDMGVSARFIERFWAFAAFAIMNVPLQLASAAALMRFYQRIVGHRDLAIGFHDCGLGDIYAPQARALIEQAGGEIITQAEVTKLLFTEERVCGVQLANGSRLAARFCVSTLPPHALREIIPYEWLAKPGVFANLAHFEPISYISVYLWFDRKLTREQFWARVYSPQDLNCDFYDLSNINVGWQGRPSVIASNIIYSQRLAGLTDIEIIERTLAELTEFLPQAARARMVHTAIHRIPLAIHTPRPGNESLRPSTRTPINGLLLAGDWVQTRLPYSMESAVASGWLAAEQVLADIGRPQKLAAETPMPERLPAWMHWTAKLFPGKRSRPAAV